VLRVPFAFAGQRWRVFGDLLEAGRAFYAEAKATRDSRQLPVRLSHHGGRAAKRGSLKERDPW